MGRLVTIGAGYFDVALPNNLTYDAGQSVILTDGEWASINPSLVGSTIIDGGATGSGGGGVSAWSSSTAYTSGSTVARNSGIYAAIGSSTNIDPVRILTTPISAPVGSNGGNLGQNNEYSRFTAQTTVTVQNIEFHVTTNQASGFVSILTDISQVASASTRLGGLANTAPVSTYSGGVGTWRTVTLPTPVTLTSGQTYYLEFNGCGASIEYSASGYTGFSNAGIFYGALPNPTLWLGFSLMFKFHDLPAESAWQALSLPAQVHTIGAGSSPFSVGDGFNEGTGAATGDRSHAEGSGSATGSLAHGEGNGTTASGVYAHAEGNATVASGQASHAEGASTNATGLMAHAEGQGGTASGNNSHAEGNSTTASGESSHAQGASAGATRYAQHAQGSFAFAAVGDAQTSTFVAGAQTTTATATALTFGKLALTYTGTQTSVLTLPTNSLYRCRITAVARRTDVTGETASFSIDVTLARESGNIRIVGSQVTSSQADAAAAAWTLVASVDTTNQALVLTATGEASKTIRWVARIETVEVA